MLVGSRNIINIPPGVNKDDNTLTSLTYTDAQSIRFYNSFPETIGGWLSVNYSNQQTLSGVPRTIFSYTDSSGTEHILIGTNTRLYSFENGGLYNITPLVTGTTAIANSLTTNYSALANNPVSTTSGSRVIGLAYSPLTRGIFQIGDLISVSGVAGTTGGIAAAAINGEHSITNVDATKIYFVVTPTASSTATGGGAGVVLSTRVINVAQVAHGFANGDRIKILAAAGFRGFAAGDLNIESVIRDVSVNAYSYYLYTATVFATSSGGTGGAATTVQGQITAGNCTFSPGLGYGGGPYSAGSYGTAKMFTSGYKLPRIWSIDRYGDGVVLTPGDQGKVYEWDGDLDIAPTILLNSPATANYVFVGNNQVITFGYNGVDNRVKTSDGIDNTNWTPGPTSTAFQGEIQSAGRLIAHSYVKDQFLLFTQAKVFVMIYIGLPEIWLIKELTSADGLLSPKSVVQIGDAVAWVGQSDFYIYNGSVLSTIPNNNVKQWFFQNINAGKYYLSFARRVIQFNEVRWFAPFGGATEPDTQIVWNYQEGYFFNDSGITRTASEEPQNPTRNQYMAKGSCDGSITSTLYQHEIGYTEDGANMTGSLTSNFANIGEGDYIQKVGRIIPSNALLPVGNINMGQDLYTMTVNAKDYDGQQNSVAFGPYSINGFTQKIDTRIAGRQRQYVYSFSGTQGFRLQKTFEEIKPSTAR